MTDFIRPEDIEALGKLLDRDVRHHSKVLSVAEVRRWMDADERFAAYVREHQPALYRRARPEERT